MLARSEKVSEILIKQYPVKDLGYLKKATAFCALVFVFNLYCSFDIQFGLWRTYRGLTNQKFGYMTLSWGYWGHFCNLGRTNKGHWHWWWHVGGQIHPPEVSMMILTFFIISLNVVSYVICIIVYAALHTVCPKLLPRALFKHQDLPCSK